MNPTLATDTADSAEATASVTPEMTPITAVYRIRCAPNAVEQVCQNIAYEQTVEVPPALAEADDRIRRWVGRIDSIQPIPGVPDGFEARISYDHLLAGGQLPQLLNLLFGNTSLQKNVSLSDVDFPEELLRNFRGPQFGVEGLRRLLGVHGRPLLATALKPVGLSIPELAALAHEFALGGGDLVKDDHNLHDATFGAFQERIARCHEGVCRANAQTGRNTLYLPNLMVPVEQLERYLKYALSLGIRGVLVSPFIAGLDVIRSLAERYSTLVMAHPTFAGGYCVEPKQGIETGLLLGKLFRLIGADISIFPNYGGRFSFSQADCQSITRHLRTPLGQLSAAWPAPAGGMRIDNLPQMSRQYGADAIFLIGGALLSHSGSLKNSTREFLKRIESQFSTRLVEPDTGFASACEVPRSAAASTNASPVVLTHLSHSPATGAWEGRPIAAYKACQSLPFRDVVRHELIGPFGEQTDFDLRYFAIAPGGFSSLEKHAHTHAVICVRGQGTLAVGDEIVQLKAMDVAYVPPMHVHQLRNESTEPFGFFCIVDHERDRPQAP
ncbi:MAG: ribulose,5-bisphosphate carboxylase/oxygenase large subunit [Planctomycetaceae bacterium]|nr:ribulose,5-bisphosphate carboxylase/oxygenase large subunit [Planctomycetaceae bacterium]